MKVKTVDQTLQKGMDEREGERKEGAGRRRKK